MATCPTIAPAANVNKSVSILRVILCASGESVYQVERRATPRSEGTGSRTTVATCSRAGRLTQSAMESTCPDAAGAEDYGAARIPAQRLPLRLQQVRNRQWQHRCPRVELLVK